MSNENIYDGITGIREDIVQKAENYQFKKKESKKSGKKAWMKWGAMAACACLVVGVTLIPMIYYNNMHHKSEPETGAYEGLHEGLQNVENPVYEVVEYSVPQEYEFTTLYVATDTDIKGSDQYMAETYGNEFPGKGIRVFSFSEGTKPEDVNIWYLDYEGDSISHICFVTKSDEHYLTSWREAGELGRALEALSGLTSIEEPMYLVQDSEMVFAVIEKTAYFLPDFSVFKPTVSYMPEIDLDGLEVTVIELTK